MGNKQSDFCVQFIEMQGAVRDPQQVGVFPPPENFFFTLVFSSIMSHWEQRLSSACVWGKEKAKQMKNHYC